jgi:hypothetical protein
MEINIEGFGTFIYCGSSKSVHRFETNGILIFERIAIRNLDGELTEESAKASLESYLNKFGKGLVRK